MKPQPKIYYFSTKTAAKDAANIAFININAARYIERTETSFTLLNRHKTPLAIFQVSK